MWSSTHRVFNDLCSTALIFCSARALQVAAVLQLVVQHSPDLRPRDDPSSFAEAVAKLTRLEALEADGALALSALALLPSSLRQLRCGLDHVNSPPADVIFSHLVNLQELECKIPGGISCRSHMPAELTALCVNGPVDALPGLSNLQQLQLPDASAGLSLLQQLPDLPALQLLELGLRGCTFQQLRQVTAIIATGTQLTGLCLLCQNTEKDLDDIITVDLGSVQLHKCLKKLPHLHMLHVSALDVSDTDALHFTGLSKLTSLSIVACLALTELAVGAMMMRLTGLRHLHLDSLELDSPLLWPAVACLSNLESLYYNCSSSTLTDSTIHLLTPLTSLTKLILRDSADQEGEDSVSEGAWSRFLESMPRLTDVELI